MLQLIRMRMSLKLMILVSILVFPLLTAFRLLQGDFDSLEGLLIWIVSGGGAMILVGYVEAYLLENWAGWHGLSRWIKTLFPIVMAALFGIIAQSLLAFNVVEGVSPAVGAIILTLINWIFSQRGYISAKSAGYAGAARAVADDG